MPVLAGFVGAGIACGRTTPIRRNGPEIVVEPLSVDFGAVDAGTIGSRVVTVSNVGTATLHVTAQLSPTTNPGFVLAGGTVRHDLTAPGPGRDGGPASSAALEVSFEPPSAAPATYRGSLDIDSDDPLNPLVVVPLTATCSCPPPDLVIGCSDGTREGFVDPATYPEIAGCSGGFSLPGVGVAAPLSPACDRSAGNDSANPDGTGCDVADLCAEGWHVCASAMEVGQKSPSGCAGVPPTPPLFFVTRQSGPGCSQCATGSSTDPTQCGGGTCQPGCAQTALTANDVFGCGNVGDASYSGTCGPLDRFGNNLCSALPPPWTCGTDGTHEADNVAKPGPSAGGALCCKD